MEQAQSRHEGQEKSLQGEAGFPPPGNRKKGGRGPELSLRRHGGHRPALPHPVRGSGALLHPRLWGPGVGRRGWSQCTRPRTDPREVRVQRARRGLEKGDKLGDWVGVDPVFNP